MRTKVRNLFNLLPLKRLRPSAIDRYVLSEVFAPFMGATVFLLFVFLMFQLLRLAELFIVHGVSWVVLVKMFLLLTLLFLPYSIPIAFLVGSLMAFGRLSSDSELVAMKASGISLLRITAPLMALALGVVGISFQLALEWVPLAEKASHAMILKIGNTRVVNSIKEGTFTSGFFDLLIFADKVDSQSNTLKRVFIYDERENGNPLTVIAEEGEILPVKTESEYSSAILMTLKDGSIHKNDLDRETYQKVDFGFYKLFLKVFEGEDSFSLKPKMYTVSEIEGTLKRIDPNHSFATELKTDLWRRFAFSLIPISFLFLGVGLGTVRTRSVRASAVFMSFILTFSFWGMQALGAVLAQNSILPISLIMLFPNILLLVLGVHFFRKAAW